MREERKLTLLFEQIECYYGCKSELQDALKALVKLSEDSEDIIVLAYKLNEMCRVHTTLTGTLYRVECIRTDVEQCRHFDGESTLIAIFEYVNGKEQLFGSVIIENVCHLHCRKQQLREDPFLVGYAGR